MLPSTRHLLLRILRVAKRFALQWQRAIIASCQRRHSQSGNKFSRGLQWNTDKSINKHQKVQIQVQTMRIQCT